MTLANPEHCTVVDPFCRAHPGGPTKTRSRCAICGKAACLACSVRTRWEGGQARICHRCLRERGRGDFVDARLATLDGHPDMGPYR